WNDPASGKLASARFFEVIELKPAPIEGASVGGAGRGQPQPSAAATASRADTQEAGLPRVVLNYKDGTPAVMERAWGLGRVVQFSSTADTAWNDLPVRLAWVPLLHRALGSIVQRQDEGLNLRVGEKFARRVPAEFLDKDATFYRPRQS